MAATSRINVGRMLVFLRADSTPYKKKPRKLRRSRKPIRLRDLRSLRGLRGLRLALDRYDDGILHADGDRCARRQRRGVAAAGHHRRASAAGADGGANRGALGAAEDATDDRAADGGAADLCGALAGGRVALSIDRVGLNRQTRAVGEDN